MKLFLQKNSPFLLVLSLCVLWFLVYSQLHDFAMWMTYSVLGLPQTDRFAMSLAFFLYDVPKIFMLLTLIVYIMGVIRTFVSPARTRKLLIGRRVFTGHVLAAVLGVFTPFCTCSAIPLFMGFLGAGIPLGVTFSFLISAPMINEVALILLFGLFGWKVALLYLSTGLVLAIVAGLILGRINVGRWIEPWVLSSRCAENCVESEQPNWSQRFLAGWVEVRQIVGKVWPYILIGIAVGALIHGYVPENYLAHLLGKQRWWAVPFAVLLGVPLYSGAAGMIPIVQSLLQKGAALGTTLAFMMAVIGLSLPEAIILRRVMKLPLIFIFFGIVAVGIMLVGFLFNVVM